MTQASHIYIQTNIWRAYLYLSSIDTLSPSTLHRNIHFRRFLRLFAGDTSSEGMAAATAIEWVSADRHVGLVLQLRSRLLPSLRRGLFRSLVWRIAGMFLRPRFLAAVGGGVHRWIHRRRTTLRSRIRIPQQVPITLSRRFGQRRIRCMDSQGNSLSGPSIFFHLTGHAVAFLLRYCHPRGIPNQPVLKCAAHNCLRKMVFGSRIYFF